MGSYSLKRWSTPFIVWRLKRPSPSTRALKIAVRQRRAGYDTFATGPSGCSDRLWRDGREAKNTLNANTTTRSAESRTLWSVSPAASKDDDPIGGCIIERLARAVGPADDDVAGGRRLAEADVDPWIVARQVAVRGPHIPPDR